MALRSPVYPGVSLEQAIDLAGKLHGKSRTNAVDREAAAKDMGFSGITGSSSKALADLGHYGLIEKAGKGMVRVSQRAVDILYPESKASKATALRDAAFAPALFESLRAHFHDGPPSENALKGYLIRQEFAPAAIPYVVASYLDTCRLIQQTAVNESHGQHQESGENGRGDAGEDQQGGQRGQPVALPLVENLKQASPPAPHRTDGVELMSGERELTTGLLSKRAGFRLIVHGKIGEKEIERLIRKLQLDKEILADDDDEAFVEANSDN